MSRLSVPAALLLALVVSACSAAGTPSTDPSQAGAHSDASASADPTSTPAEPGTPAAGTDLTACEIVTPADIEAAVGLTAGTVAAAESEATPNVLSPGHTSCTYANEAWGGVIVDLTPEDGANLYDAARSAASDASDMIVVGSDGAFYAPTNHRAYIWKGAVTVLLQISYLSVDDRPEDLDVMQSLAEAIIAKLA